MKKQHWPLSLSSLILIVLALCSADRAFSQNENALPAPANISLCGIGQLQLSVPLDSVRHLLEPVPIPDYFQRVETTHKTELDSMRNMSWPEEETYRLNRLGHDYYATVWGVKILDIEISFDRHQKAEVIMIFFPNQEKTNSVLLKKSRRLNKRTFHSYHPEASSKSSFSAHVFGIEGLPTSVRIYNYDAVGKIVYDRYTIMSFGYVSY